MSRNPRDLDFEEAAALLLPMRGGVGSPAIPPWKPWTRPPERKAIDDEVARQIERRDQRARAPHMRARAELDALRIRCPYAYARLAVARAAGDGTHDRLTNEAAKPAPLGTGWAAQLKDYAAEATDLANRLSALLESVPSSDLASSPHPAGARRSLDDDNAQRDQIYRAHDRVDAARDALKVLAEAARAQGEQLVPSHATGDLWRQAFVMRVGIAWRTLTGCDPSPSSDHFARFVAAGFNSLGPGLPTDATEWRHPIGTACARMAKRPEWDRWDREERETLPPGTIVATLGEYQERQRQREERRDADICALLDAATPEDASAARLRLLAQWSWAPDTPEGERDLARLQAARRAAQ